MYHELTFVRMSDRAPHYWQDVVTNMSESQQAVEALQESEARLETLLSSLDDLVFELDENGTYLGIWTTNDALLIAPTEPAARPDTRRGHQRGGRPQVEADHCKCRRDGPPGDLGVLPRGPRGYPVVPGQGRSDRRVGGLFEKVLPPGSRHHCAEGGRAGDNEAPVSRAAVEPVVRICSGWSVRDRPGGPRCVHQRSYAHDRG